MKVDKSSEARKKEKQIAELEQQLKRTRTTLKNLKTRLANMQTRIESVARSSPFQRMSHLRERILTLFDHLGKLTGKLRKDKRLSREDKALIDELYQGVVGGLKDNLPDLETPDEFREEATEARMRDAFKAFRVEPPQKEQRDIRKLYLSLSKQYHPDLARDEKERAHFHHLQQQINEAYQAHDFQALADLAQLWEDPREQAPATLDALDSKIGRLTNQLRLLKDQQERLSREIRQLRDSELGQLLTHIDGLERSGLSFGDIMQVDALEEMTGLLEKLKAALEDTDRQGKMSPFLQEVLDELTAAVPGSEDMLFGMLAEMLEDDDEDLFWDEEDYLPNPNPRFPVGTAVRIARKSEEYYVDEREREHFFSLKGYVGTVTAAYLGEEDRPVYAIDLDIESMKRLPAGFIKFRGETYRNVEYIRENVLARDDRSPDSPDEAQVVFREILYRHLLADLPPEQRKRLQGILLAAPEKSDEQNWVAYLEEHLSLPFSARTRGLFSGVDPGRKVKVIGSLGYSPEDGLIVRVKTGKQEFLLPLADLAGTDDGRVAQMLDDYFAWFELLL